MASIPSPAVHPAPMDMLVDWTFNKIPAQTTIRHAIGQETATQLLLPLVDLIVDYLESGKKFRDVFFGEREWKAHYGDVPPAPPLPLDIDKIFHGPCPIHPGRTMMDTHMLVYLPVMVDGRPLTLKLLRELPKTSVNLSTRPEFESLGDQVVEAGWVMMSNHSILASKGLGLDKQQTTITDLAKRASANYVFPRALDVTVCILARIALSQMYPFCDTLIRCQEEIHANIHDTLIEGHVLVGCNYSLRRVEISYGSDFVDPNAAIVGLRRLRSPSSRVFS